MELAPPASPRDFTRPHQEGDAALRKYEEWLSSLKPWDAFENGLVEQVAVQGVRVERCQHHERALLSLNAAKAALDWDADRERDAEDLGERLATSPSRVSKQLAATKQGCDWLLLRWEGLARLLEAGGLWGDAQTSLALDLLGVPAELRVAGTTPMEVEPEAKIRLIRAEIDRLSSRKARALEEIDRRERDMAALGFGPDRGGELAKVRRFERSCSRRLEWSRDQLRSRKRAPRPDDPGPGPDRGTFRPSPPPVPSPAPPIVEKTEDEWRRLTQERAANKQAAASSPASSPAKASPSALQTPIDPSTMTEAERMAIVRSHPEFLALSPVDRVMSLLYGEIPPPNRKARRARRARGRRPA